eukprot:6173705-Pleurochrysis_carterae.AAC.3
MLASRRHRLGKAADLKSQSTGLSYLAAWTPTAGTYTLYFRYFTAPTYTSMPTRDAFKPTRALQPYPGYLIDAGRALQWTALTNGNSTATLMPGLTSRPMTTSCVPEEG